jgi:hypothetical protein
MLRWDVDLDPDLDRAQRLLHLLLHQWLLKVQLSGMSAQFFPQLVSHWLRPQSGAYKARIRYGRR